MALIASILIFLVSVHKTGGFLLQNGNQSMTGGLQGASSTDMTTQYLLGLLVDEKNSRHQLENLVNFMGDKLTALETKVTQLEQYNSEVQRKLEKEQSNRKFLEAHVNSLEQKLHNFTSGTANVLKWNSSSNTLLEQRLNNITTVNGYLEQRLNDVVAMNTLLEQKLNNVTLLDGKVAQLERDASDLSRRLNSAQNNTKWLMAEYSRLEGRVDDFTRAPNNTGHTYAVGFTAYNVSAGSSNGLGFANSTYISDDSFNMTTGVFTCKIPGLYVFTATVIRSGYSGGGEFSCYIKVNGTSTLRIFANDNGNIDSYPSASGTVIVKLKKDDTVYMGDCININYAYVYSTSFSGFLLAVNYN